MERDCAANPKFPNVASQQFEISKFKSQIELHAEKIARTTHNRRIQRGYASGRSGQEHGCQEDRISAHHRFRWLRGICRALIFLRVIVESHPCTHVLDYSRFVPDGTQKPRSTLLNNDCVARGSRAFPKEFDAREPRAPHFQQALSLSTSLRRPFVMAAALSSPVARIRVDLGLRAMGDRPHAACRLDCLTPPPTAWAQRRITTSRSHARRWRSG